MVTPAPSRVRLRASTNLRTPSRSVATTETRSLDYNSCDAEELCDFIQSRATLTATSIHKLSKLEMVTHLESLDTQQTFYRFMDLAPELRLNIYQQALRIDGEESKNHTALLRVSKLVYREPEPVLYCDNSFHLKLGHAVVKISVSESWERHWHLSDASGWSRNSPYSYTYSPIRIDMLLGLRQLTMRLCDLVGEREGERYTGPGPSQYQPWTCYSLTTVCLMLSSASRLRTLTITNVPPQGTSWNVHQLAQLLFPLSFLPEPARISVEGGSSALHTALRNSRGQGHSNPNFALSTCGTLLSRAMDVLAEAREKADAGISSMLLVALSRVLFRRGCLGGRDLRSLVANLQTLENIVGKVEAELAA